MANHIRKDLMGSILDGPADAAPGLDGLDRLTRRDPSTLVREDEPDDDPVVDSVVEPVVKATEEADPPGAPESGLLSPKESNVGTADPEALTRLIRRDPAERPPDDAAAGPQTDATEGERREFRTSAPKPARPPEMPTSAIQLSQQTMDKLEQARQELARSLPPEAAGKLSATLVSEVALRIVLGDLAKKGEGSLLARVLRKLLVRP